MIKPVTDIDTYITKECDVEEGDVVVDIGAHVGEFVKYALEKKAGRIIAFEPCSELFNICKEIKEVEWRNEAVCNFNGVSNVYYQPNDTPSSSLFKQIGICEKVSVVDFRDILKETGIIDFLKSDCEGGENFFMPSLTDEEFLKIRKLAIEWHFFEKSDPILTERFIDRLESLNYGHDVTHFDLDGGRNGRTTIVAWRRRGNPWGTNGGQMGDTEAKKKGSHDVTP